MTLYSSTPDGIAQSQQFYDQLRLGANQNNAARFDAASARALQSALSQREADQRRQDALDAEGISNLRFNTELAFRQNESNLDRASRERNVKTQYDFTHADRQDALSQRDFEQAQRLAMAGQTPQTEAELKVQYPNFDSNQIKVLAQASNQHGLDRFQNAFEQSIRAGQPMGVEAVKNYVNPNSSLYQDALDHRQSILAPIQAEHDQGVSKANRGNFAARIVADTSAPPLPTNVGTVFNPLNWTQSLNNLVRGDNNAVPRDSIIQSQGDWQQRAPAIVAALKSGQEPLVQTDASTGQFVPTIPDFGGGSPIILPSRTAGSPTPTIRTQSEFDALPSGSIYIGKGGKQYRKP